MKKRVLSGVRPTGSLHIGHLLGKLQSWVALQDEYECLYFVADYHALTTLKPEETKGIQKNTLEMVLDWLAAGVDPQKSTLFVQSQVPEHAELSLLLGMVCPVSWLLRNPTFKDQAKHYPDNVNLGLLSYPVLQTADIIMYKAEVVPVGEDQLPHLELAREITRAFNHRFGKTFPEPNPLLSAVPRVMGLDRPNEKMSKSFGPSNYVALSDSEAVVQEKIARAVTDVGPEKGKKMSPGTKNLFTLLEQFSPFETQDRFKKIYRSGEIRYQELKQVLASDINSSLEPIRQRRKELEKEADVTEILKKGSEKMRKIAKKTVIEVKQKMGLIT